jgi:hypothetical protein
MHVHVDLYDLELSYVHEIAHPELRTCAYHFSPHVCAYRLNESIEETQHIAEAFAHNSTFQHSRGCSSQPAPYECIVVGHDAYDLRSMLDSHAHTLGWHKNRENGSGYACCTC